MIASLALFFAVALPTTLPPSTQGGPRGLDLRSLVVRAADRDRDGSVEADEFSAFLVSLAPDPEGRLERDTVRAEVLLYDWDWNQDGTATGEDLRAVFASLDVDADRVLRATELAGAPGGYVGLMAVAVLLHAADAQGAGEASADEWRELEMAGSGSAGSLDLAAIAEWLKRVQAEPPPEDPNAVSPGVYLLTLSSALDADFDGKITLADMQRLFSGFDANGDGRVERAEFAPRREGRQSGPSPAETLPPDEDRVAGRPLIPWQRSLDDALALVRRTQKPLLVCVNADGESASEIIVRGRYRDPEFAALVRGFVPILLAPFPHTAREHDDAGRRIPDPRFGRILDSEHIAHDELVTGRYLRGERVAPRHAAFDADGNTIFDVYLVTDLSIIDAALREHGAFEIELPDPWTLGEEELLESPDAACRDRLEELFAVGDEATRVRLAAASLSGERETQHPEVLRMALLDASTSVREAGVATLVQHASTASADLLLPALEASGEAGELRESVLSALRSLASSAPDSMLGKRADRLARVSAALERISPVLDRDRWRLAMAFAPRQEEIQPAGEQKTAVVARITDLEARSEGSPDDRELHVLFADALMRLARIMRLEGANPSYLFEDVRNAARLATSEERPEGRALGYLAWSSYLLGDPEAVNFAARALPLLRVDPCAPLTAQVLEVFAKGRLNALYPTLDDGTFEDEWIADLLNAYEVILAHPLVEERQAVDYVGFLGAIEAHRRQDAVVRRALERFPASADLHIAFRNGVLRDHGALALEKAYETLDVPRGQEASFVWYAGLATLVAAERHVANQEGEAALAAYRLSVERFRESVALEPSYRGTAFHYVALALAGTASLHVEEAHFDLALAAICEGIATSPDSAATLDGLGNTPASTAKRLHRALVLSGRATEASALQDELGSHGVRIGS